MVKNSNRQTCKKRYCEGPWAKEQSAKLKKVAKALDIKIPKSKASALDKESQEACVSAYCNPTCEGTLFQDGKAFPEALAKKYKNKKLIRNILNETRKTLFGKKTKITKNGFYDGIKTTRRKQLKARGALSGCSLV